MATKNKQKNFSPASNPIHPTITHLLISFLFFPYHTNGNIYKLSITYKNKYGLTGYCYCLSTVVVSIVSKHLFRTHQNINKLILLIITGARDTTGLDYDY
jgi:hypothetical protein